MGRGIERLTALTVTRARQPGLYADGGHLYLQVTRRRRKDRAHQAHRSDVTKSWVFRFALKGHTRDMGLGSLHSVSLSQARAKARSARELLADGIDPIEAKRAAHEQALLDSGKALTFSEATSRFITGRRAAWRSTKHAAQWQSTLERYAYPVIGPLPVHVVDTTLVLKVLEPIWAVKPETASRLRGRIESVLNWATVRGYRKGDNPAQWRGHLDKALPPLAEVRKVEHHAALAYADMPDFMQALRQLDGTPARALEFTILTAARTGETIGAKWSEVDLRQGTWTIPGARMKAGEEHRVPLSPRAVAILEQIKAPSADMAKSDQADTFVFPSARRGKPLPKMTFLLLLERMGRSDLTTHGFRSTFRDWAAETTNYPREVAEMALAHIIGDKTEAAYRRGDLFQKRRQLMDAWARHCATVKSMGDVVSIAR